MKIALGAIALFALACSPTATATITSASASASTAAPVVSAASAAPVVSAAPAAFPGPVAGRLDAVFRGTCAPPGSRGGCYSLTLKADGTFRQVLLDAIQGGTYAIQGDKLVLTFPKGGPAEQALTTPDGFQTLSNGYKRVASL